MSCVGVSTRTVHPLLNRHYSTTTKQQSDNSINEEVEEEVCDNTRERRREITEAKVERLALLPDLEYQIERKPTARQLEIPLRALDSLVKAKRPKGSGDDDFTLPHWNVEPWPDAVVGADVLDGLKAIFQKYI
jgi:hypothetical protein